jgi:hypothetical protein
VALGAEIAFDSIKSRQDLRLDVNQSFREALSIQFIAENGGRPGVRNEGAMRLTIPPDWHLA